MVRCVAVISRQPAFLFQGENQDFYGRRVRKSDKLLDINFAFGNLHKSATETCADVAQVVRGSSGQDNDKMKGQ